MKHAILPLSRRDRRCETSLCTKLEEGREEKKKEEGKRRKEERGAGRRKGKGRGGGGGGGGRAGGRGRGEGGQVGGRSLRRRGEAGRATAAERRCGEVAFGRARHVVAGDEQGSLSLSLFLSPSLSQSLPSLFISLYTLSPSLSLSLSFYLLPKMGRRGLRGVEIKEVLHQAAWSLRCKETLANGARLLRVSWYHTHQAGQQGPLEGLKQIISQLR